MPNSLQWRESERELDQNEKSTLILADANKFNPDTYRVETRIKKIKVSTLLFYHWFKWASSQMYQLGLGWLLHVTENSNNWGLNKTDNLLQYKPGNKWPKAGVVHHIHPVPRCPGGAILSALPSSLLASVFKVTSWSQDDHYGSSHQTYRQWEGRWNKDKPTKKKKKKAHIPAGPATFNKLHQETHPKISTDNSDNSVAAPACKGHWETFSFWTHCRRHHHDIPPSFPSPPVLLVS